MPVGPSKTLPIPSVSVPAYVFGSRSQSLGEDPILLDAERPHDHFLTLASYRRWSECLAAGLANAGLKVGERVLFISGNSVAYPVVYMGVLMAGAILSGSSAARPLAELINQTTELEPTFILASRDGLAIAKRAAASVGLDPSRVFLFDHTSLFAQRPASNGERSPDEQRHWQDLLCSQDPTTFDWSTRATPEQIAVIYYTSGSTGNSKGVVLTHRNIVANAHQYIDQQHDDPLGPEHAHPLTWVTWIPMFQVFSGNQSCVICPRRGVRNYIMRSFDLDAYLRYTALYRAHSMSLLPPHVIAMLASPAARAHDLSCVRHALVGGAPLCQSVIARWEALMPHPHCAIIQAWGMTETTYIAMNNAPTGRAHDASVGRLLPNVSAKIMSLDAATELPPNTTGELWIHGPNVAAGYWRRPELSARAFLPDGWLRTGDLAFHDAAGRWFVRDRVQDAVPTPGGALALPSDIEARLLGVPGVLDAGATGVPDAAAAARVPRAFVVLDGTAGARLADVRAAYRRAAPPHEELRGGLFALREIPRVRGAKVDRGALQRVRVDGE